MNGVDRMPLPLTAILACRNAAPTLGRHLDHLERMGADVIVIDHGSTDATPEIAADRKGAPVVEIINVPFKGVFDLTRQLWLKREVIGGLKDCWVLHADADEFVDPPGETALLDMLRVWDDSSVLAVECQEYLFVPRNEEERHLPGAFETTMRHYVPFRERDPKQRIFRSSAALGLWMQTGGHTITRNTAEVAPERLRLRHYIGLSLDQIRSEYLGRVVAPGDIGKHWHDSRGQAEKLNVQSPAAALLQCIDDGWRHKGFTNQLPMFGRQPATKPTTSPRPEDIDLGLLSVSRDIMESVVTRVKDLFGDLRVGEVAMPTPGGPPVLGLLAHPGRNAPSDPECQRHHAEEWLRRVASARQAALFPGVRYRELRIEDLDAAPGRLQGDVVSLFLTATPNRSRDAFVSEKCRPIRVGAYPPRVCSIAGPFARDLGYV